MAGFSLQPRHMVGTYICRTAVLVGQPLVEGQEQLGLNSRAKSSTVPAHVPVAEHMPCWG